MRPTSDAQLYRMELRYDREQTAPIHTFDAGSRELELGVRTEHVNLGRGLRDGSLRVELARGVPRDLSLDLGAADAELDLGGLSLDALHVQAGASSSTVRFDTPNPRMMRRLAIHSGAASFRGVRLANAHTPIVSVDAGVDGVDLDFGGTWTQDVDLRAFAAFDHDGLERRGRAWVSPNWDDAAHHLTVRGSAAFGKLAIDRD